MIAVDDFTSSDPGFSDGSGMGIPGIFVVFFVLVVVLAIGSAIWRITAARSMARRAGLDPGEATAMTVLSEDGLAATYLASNLRAPAAADPSVAARPTSAERLRELQGLKDQGLISDAEYATRRQAILDEI